MEADYVICTITVFGYTLFARFLQMLVCTISAIFLSIVLVM